MRRKREHRGKSATTDGERVARIDRITAEVTRQYRAGSELDPGAVARQHPDLMPELGDRLRFVRGIEQARQQARKEPRLPDDCGGVGSGADPDLDVLRAALDGYKILERLHAGGQGVVYKALQLKSRRFVAIKVLLSGPLSSRTQRRRFEREVKLLSRVRHPSIVTLHDSGVIRGLPYLVMEFVEGGLSIDRYALLHDLSAREIVTLFSGVCRAVNSAHQNGVIHRDLKPSNILVDFEGTARVLDFGLAKDIWQPDSDDGQAIRLITVGVVGTLPYLSPEQARGSDEIDVRTDVYSLGVVLFQLLTGDFPYPVDGPTETVRSHIITREPLRLRKAASQHDPCRPPDIGQINDDLEAIVQKALEKGKARRYQSALELAEDLERFLAKEAVRAQSSRRFYLIRKTMRRYRIPLAVGAAFLILVGAFAGELLRLATRVEAVDAAGRAQVRTTQVSNIALLRALQDSWAQESRRAEVARMSPDRARVHLQRYANPPADPDGRLERIARSRRANLLESIRDPDRPGHDGAVRWLDGVGDELDSIAATLETTSFRVALDEDTALALSLVAQPWSAMDATCEAFLARAYRCRAAGDVGGALADLDATRRLAMDLGDGVTFMHKRSSISWRLQTYVFIRAAITDALRTGASPGRWLDWLEADPILADLEPALVHAGLGATQLLNASLTMDAPSGPTYLDLDRLNELTGGYLDRLGALTRTTRSQARSYRKGDTAELVQRFITCAIRWDELPYSELDAAINARGRAIVEERGQSPALYVFPSIGVGYRTRIQGEALRRALRLAAWATRYRDQQGRWPADLSGALNPREPHTLIDPMTGGPFVYEVMNGLPHIRSTRLQTNIEPLELMGETAPGIPASGRLTYFPAPVTP